MFSYLTAGESHGPALVGILDGIPAHSADRRRGAINQTLARRQGGYGRGARMKIERDEVEFLAGVRGGETLGSPIAVVVHNRDYLTPKVRALMDPLTGSGDPLTNPAPRPRRLCGRAQIPAARSAQRSGARERARNRDARLPRSDLRAVSRGARHRDAQLRRPASATSRRSSRRMGTEPSRGQRRSLSRPDGCRAR